MKLTVVACVIALVVQGCATTKNVMNKATFGLIGGEEKKSGDQQASAQEVSKAERKAREKEEKRQREAEKRAAKEDEKARKAAEREERKSEEKPGLMRRMTFGLIGGEKKSTEEQQQEAEAQAREKDQKRQKKEAREQEKREAKAAKEKQKQEAEAKEKDEKLAAKERKEQEKQAKVQEKQSVADQKAAESEKSEPKSKRSLMNRMTFGLVGGKKSDESDKSTSSDQSTASVPDTEPGKEDKKAQKRAEKEQREAEKQARKDAEKAEKEQAKQAKAEEQQPESAAPGEEPKEKRSLMSRMTFGLVGGKKSDKSDSSDQSDQSTSSTASTQPALAPEQLAMAAPADAHYDVEPASALDGEARKLAKMPFKTSVDLSTKSASGKAQATASRETYSKNGYGITDIGDVRIAVQGMTFDGESRAGGIVISSDDRAAVGGKAGTGNSAFVYEYAKGVTAVQFGTVNFTIAKSVISIGGKSVPIGQGKKLIVVDGQGNVIGAYAAE